MAIAWYDGCLLMILASVLLRVAGNGKHYNRCKLPIHTWIVVDLTVVIVLRMLMLVDNFIVATIRLDNGDQLRGKILMRRVVVLCVTYAVLYPFLWVWTVVGVIWFTTESDCLPGNQLWSIVQWLLFTFIGLVWIAVLFGRNWLKRRLLLRRAFPDTRVSEFKVLVSMIPHPNNLPNEAIVLTIIRNQQIQMRETLLALFDVLIRMLPIYILRDIPADCSDCPICLEDLRVGQEVRGLPCAHIFHVTCIDTWLRGTMTCPQCRSMVFPTVRRQNTASVPGGAEQSTVPESQHVSYEMRMQSCLKPVQTDNPQPLDPSSSVTRTSTTNITDALPCESTPSSSTNPVPCPATSEPVK